MGHSLSVFMHTTVKSVEKIDPQKPLFPYEFGVVPFLWGVGGVRILSHSNLLGILNLFSDEYPFQRNACVPPPPRAYEFWDKA